MNQESIRDFCRRLPHATEEVQWGDHLLFKIGGKMFCVMPLEPSPNVLSFKVTAENFHQLPETEGIIPAPYMARASWLALKKFSLLRDDELKQLLRESYDLVFAGLPRRLREELTAAPKSKTKKKAAKKSPKRRVASKASKTKPTAAKKSRSKSK